MHKYLLWFAVYIGTLNAAFAAQQTSTTQLYDVRTLSLKNGLVQSSVRGLLQDRQGFIWLGTEAGLQRFDGLHLKTLEQLIEVPIERQLDTIWVNHLLENQQGAIVIASRRNGLIKYDPQLRQISQYTLLGYNTKLLDKTEFFETCEDKQQQLWAAAKTGLLLIDQQSGQWQVKIPSKDASRFTDLDCQGQYVVARHHSELFRFDKKSAEIQSFSIKSNTDNPDSLHITQLPDGITLVGKQDGLFRINTEFTELQPIWPSKAQQQLLPPQADRSEAAVNYILVDDANTVWLGTAHQGLILLSIKDGQILQQLRSNYKSGLSLSGDNVIRMIKDHSGLIWASIYGVGVDRVNLNQNAMKTFFSYTESPLVDNDITAISAGPNNALWFATNRSGVKRLSLETMESTDYSAKLIEVYHRYVATESPYISDIAVDSLNRLWVTSNAGIIRLNLTTLKSAFYPSSPYNTEGPRVRGRDIYLNRQGTLYVADKGAILRYDSQTDKFIRLPLADITLPDAKERLWGIRQHTDGTLYVLGTNNIYTLVDNTLLVPLLASQQLENTFGGRMSAFVINPNGDIFIAAQGALIEIDMTDPNAPQVHSYSGKLLPDNYFYAIELDNNNNPWLSTNNGLVHFDAVKHSYHHFSLSDGVLVREFNGRSSIKRANGHIIFGGIDGWTVIAPEKLHLSQSTPALTLSSYQVGAQPVVSLLPSQGIEMDHSDHWLQFSFSALDYHSPEENQYAYFLEGFDPDWREFGNKPEISFAGLPPGKYLLHAKAATKRGNWHPQPLTIPINITPPFYRSMPAYLAYLLCLVGFISLILWRRNKLERERRHYVKLIETSQERMRLALWGSGDSIWDWYIEKDLIFRTAFTFLGYDEQQGTSDIAHFKALIHPDDLPLFEQELGEVLAGHTAEYTAQFRMIDTDGEWRWVADQGKVVETTVGNKPVRLSGAIRDISQLKQQEQQLQALNDELEQKIEERTRQYIDKNEQLTDTLGTLQNTQDQLVESEKMASLGNLVAGISHEINTPVGVALTAASHNSLTLERLQGLFVKRQLTVKEMEKGLSQLKTSNDLIESSINRTAHLIQTFKQVAVDHDHHDWRIIEMPSYLQEILPTFNAHFANTNHKITVLEGERFDIECSPGDLYQILTQLISNSVDHGFSGHKQGQITIAAEKQGDSWLLKYHDNGHGLLNETQEHIFEPFYTTKRGNGYAGLGMHLVFNIVSHSLAGNIECFSEPGKGTSFELKLPIKK